MGSGKSHSGKRLAALLGLPFIDQDQLVEMRAGQPITEIFSRRGEDHFRRTEASVLRELAQLPRFVLATGGGAPVHHGNMDWMNDHGTTVFLDPPPEILVSRLSTETEHRPLLQQSGNLRDFIEGRLAQRRPFYEKAAIHLRPTYANTDVARLLADQLLRHSGQ